MKAKKICSSGIRFRKSPDDPRNNNSQNNLFVKNLAVMMSYQELLILLYSSDFEESNDMQLTSFPSVFMKIIFETPPSNFDKR